MISTFTAFFDANVFYGARLRSLMLYIAQSKLFRARWSEAVHDEWVQNLLRNRPDLKAENLARTRELMNAAVPDCLVTGYEGLIAAIELPDPDDRHVVAAALLAQANVIVTFNERDFPPDAIDKFRLGTKHPDAVLLETFSLAPEQFSEAAIEDFLHYQRPSLNFSDYLASLAKAGVPGLANALEPLDVLVREK